MLDIIERNNKDNQNYIDMVKKLLYYFKLGGFYILSQENYGYRIYINKNNALNHAKYLLHEMTMLEQFIKKIQKKKNLGIFVKESVIWKRTLND